MYGVFLLIWLVAAIIPEPYNQAAYTVLWGSFSLLHGLLFGLAHFAPGPGLVVLTDLSLIILDSILFGAMFARRNNLWVVWLAHLLGDIVGLLVLASL